MGFRLLAMLGLLTWQDPALAVDLSGLYFGGNFGRGRNAYDTGLADAALQQTVAAANDELDISDRSVRRLSHVWWGEVGYHLTPNLAVEGEYLHLGGMQYLNSGILTLNGAGQSIFTGQELTSHGPALSIVGRFPISEWFELHVLAGDYLGKAELNQSLSTGSFQSSSRMSKSDSSLLVGAGLAFNFGGHWSIRGDFLRANKTGGGDVGKFSVDMVTGGISFTF